MDIYFVCVVYLQEWVWQQKHTTGSPPLGIYQCAFTVVGRRVVVYGGYCCHDDCYHNSLHELNTINLEWTVLAPQRGRGGSNEEVWLWYCGIQQEWRGAAVCVRWIWTTKLGITSNSTV